jgi:hypothetical protein
MKAALLSCLKLHLLIFINPEDYRPHSDRRIGKIQKKADSLIEPADSQYFYRTDTHKVNPNFIPR